MIFLQFHQKNRPVLIVADSIKQIRRAAKGNGSFIFTDMESNDIEVDESQEQIVQYLIELDEELDIEVELFANDD